MDRCSFWCRSNPHWRWLLSTALSSPLGSCLTCCTGLFALGSFPEHLSCPWPLAFFRSGFGVGFHFVWTSNIPWQHSLISDDQICPILGCSSSPWSFHLKCRMCSWFLGGATTPCTNLILASATSAAQSVLDSQAQQKWDADAVRQTQTKGCHRPWSVWVSCCC